MSANNSGLKARVLSVIGLGITITAAYYFYSHIGILYFSMVMVFLASLEYANMHFPKLKNRRFLIGNFTLVNAAIMSAVIFGLLSPMLLAIALVISAVLCIWSLRSETDNTKQLRALSDLFIGFIYIGLFSGLGIRLLKFPETQKWFWFLIVIVAVGDIAGYFVGRSFGKNPLYKTMSPNKTWEGFWGAIIASTLVSLGFYYFFIPQAPLWVVVLLGPLVSFTAQTGDLFESLLKRVAGRKDSGRLLPGHGGVLDRIDGHLFAAPIIYFAHYFLP